MSKVAAIAIYLHHATGLEHNLTEKMLTRDDCGTNLWQKANELIRAWAWSVASGADKVDFMVSYADGSTYQGTIEIVAPGAGVTEKVGEHMRAFCECYGGRQKPGDLSEKDYQELLRKWSPEPEVHTRWLDEYEIGE
jgi:hypothetical protein